MFVLATVFIAIFVFFGFCHLLLMARLLKSRFKPLEDVSFLPWSKFLVKLYKLDHCIIITKKNNWSTISRSGLSNEEFKEILRITLKEIQKGQINE